MATATSRLPMAEVGHTHFKDYTYSMNPDGVKPGKYVLQVSHMLKALDKNNSKIADEGSEFIRTEFYPRVPKVMASHLRGSSAQRYITEHIFTKEEPKWFKELDSFEQETFDEIHAILEDGGKIDPVEVFDLLDGLDIDLRREEVNEALEKASDFITRRVDFSNLLFELCDSVDYLQRMKKSKQLYKCQKMGQYTKRQVLFYSIISKATFPEFPRDPIIYRANCHFRPHVLKYYMPSMRTTGLTTRQLQRKAQKLEKVVSCWRESVKSVYNESVVFPPEPPLVRQQRLRKEGSKGRIKPTTYTKPLKKDKDQFEEKKKGLLLSDKITILATRAYPVCKNEGVCNNVGATDLPSNSK